jgi:hypothetical protein
VHARHELRIRAVITEVSKMLVQNTISAAVKNEKKMKQVRGSCRKLAIGIKYT